MLKYELFPQIISNERIIPQKAINFKALDDPKVMKQLEEMFGRNEVSIAPNVAYKKSVNFLKSKTKKR